MQIYNRFVDKNIYDAWNADIGTTNGFIVERLVEGWQKFADTLENNLIKLVSVESMPSIGCRPNVVRFIVTFANNEVLSALIKLPLTYTCPLPGKEKESRGKEIAEPQRKMHDREVNFYEQFGGKLAISGFPLLKMYFAKKFGDNAEKDEKEDNKTEESEYIPPMLIIEDFLPVANKIELGNKEQLDNSQVKNVIETLANLHKYVMGMQNDKWKCSLSRDSAAKKFITSIVLKPEMKFDVDELEQHFGNIYKKLKPIFTEEFIDFVINEASLKEGLPDVPVLNLASMNCLFYKEEKTKLMALHDFQMISLGSPAQDLANLIQIALYNKSEKDEQQQELQEELEQKMLAYYYELLTTTSNDKSQKPPPVAVNFSLEQLCHCYHLCKVLSSQIAMITFVMANKQANKMPANLSEHFEKVRDYAILAGNQAIQILEQEAPQWLGE